MSGSKAAASVAARFRLPGEIVVVEPHGRGHINDSYIVVVTADVGRRRYLLQRINDHVFRQPAEVMQNIQRVTTHITNHPSASEQQKSLVLVPANDGRPFYTDYCGGYWRMYPFIERTRVFETVGAPAIAEQAGRAFGRFQVLLADLPAPPLEETLPGFHDTGNRASAFREAIAADTQRRVAAVRTEVAFVEQRSGECGRLADLLWKGALPERVVHNDAKISNVLFDAEGDVAVCIVDLDTVMPGLAVHDFGDMVRSMTCRAAEDEPDLSCVRVDLELFEALARGYVLETRSVLTDRELDELVHAGWQITLEQGVRFLMDYVQGDVYYKTQRSEHNLERARTQFKLVESLEAHERELNEIVQRVRCEG